MYCLNAHDADVCLLLNVLPAAGCTSIIAGGGFGGAPIRSRLVGDGNLPDDPPVVLAPQRGPPPDAAARGNAWRPGAEGSTPPDRWNGAAPLVSDSSHLNAADTTAAAVALVVGRTAQRHSSTLGMQATATVRPMLCLLSG